MISNMFSEIDKLKFGMDAAWKRNEVILNNIANVDTPDFKRSSVSFESYYKAALEGESDFTLKQTRTKHIDIGANNQPVIAVHVDHSTSMRMDGNNVDPDKEMVDLSQSVIYYQTLQSKLSSEITQLRTAITGGR